MKKRIRLSLKLFLVYFPLLLVACQVVADLWYLIDFDTYAKAYFYLGWVLGTNLLVSFFMVCYTEYFYFCAVSKWAARAELLFAFIYGIIQQDNIYNIAFQIVIGIVAIHLTIRYYAHKFPLCRLGLLWNFINNVRKKGSCVKGIERHDMDVKNLLRTKRPRHEIISNRL